MISFPFPRICWDSNGWFRLRIDGKDWVVWSRGARSRQDLHDSSLRGVIAKSTWSKSPIPVSAGMVTEVGSDSYKTRIEVTSHQEIQVTLNDGNVIHLPRRDAGSANFQGHKLCVIPIDNS